MIAGRNGAMFDYKKYPTRNEIWIEYGAVGGKFMSCPYTSRAALRCSGGGVCGVEIETNFVMQL